LALYIRKKVCLLFGNWTPCYENDPLDPVLDIGRGTRLIWLVFLDRVKDDKPGAPTFPTGVAAPPFAYAVEYDGECGLPAALPFDPTSFALSAAVKSSGGVLEGIGSEFARMGEWR
jgi:hypothetical protein